MATDTAQIVAASCLPPAHRPPWRIPTLHDLRSPATLGADRVWASNRRQTAMAVDSVGALQQWSFERSRMNRFLQVAPMFHAARAWVSFPIPNLAAMWCELMWFQRGAYTLRHGFPASMVATPLEPWK